MKWWNYTAGNGQKCSTVPYKQNTIVDYELVIDFLYVSMRNSPTSHCFVLVPDSRHTKSFI